MIEQAVLVTSHLGTFWNCEAEQYVQLTLAQGGSDYGLSIVR